MSRAYILDRDTLATVGLVDQSYAKITYTRRYQATDTFTLEINRKRLYASEIRKGRILYLPDEGNRAFLVEQIQLTQSGERSKDNMVVTGRSLEGIAMAERLALPPAGESHDALTDTPAETAIKHYVDVNAVTTTDPDRALPNLTIATDAARGIDVDTAARYQYVLDFVQDIGLLSGLGWEIILDRSDPMAPVFVFDILEGVDRTASVFFDFAFETLEQWDELDSDLDSKTLAVVAGQGEGIDRDIEVRGSGAGFDRREAFVDARDVELGNTDLLDARGDAFLAGSTGGVALEATIHQFGSFRYLTHWDLGDLVLVRNEEREIEYGARIVEVSVTINKSPAAPTIVATLGRPFPTLRSRTAGGSAGTADKGSADASGGIPTGAIMAWTTASPPTGWLICNGASVLRSTYADLFAVIGTTYGSVDGTHFTLPDIRQKVILGLAAAGTGSVLGGTGGAIDHTHTGPSHTHTGPSHTHTGPSHTHSTPTHAHTLSAHTHTGPSHTHTGPSHAHTSAGHTHTMANHTHTGPSHTHGFAATHQHDTALASRGVGAISIDTGAYGTKSGSLSITQTSTAAAASGTFNGMLTEAKSPGTSDAGGTGATGAPSTNTSDSTTPSDTGSAGTGATGAAGTGATGAPSSDTTDTSGSGTSGAGGTGATGAGGTGATGAEGTGATGTANPPFIAMPMIIKT